MKILNSINKAKMRKSVLVVLLLIVFSIGLSHIGSDRNNSNMFKIDVTGFNLAYADSVGWNGVRAMATLVRAVNRTLNALYATFKAWGLNFTISFNVQIPGPNYYLSVKINDSQSGVQGSVDSAGVTYANRIQIKDVDSSGPVIFQLFFDNPDDSSIGNGCLLIIKPYYFEAVRGTLFESSGIFEARVETSGSDKIMYISFDGNPWKNNPPTYVKSGRIKLVDDGTNYNITGLAYVNVDGSALHQTCSLTAGDAFYTLVYIATKNSPYYSTALWGWNNSSISDQICSINNPYNYGHFNASAGYVCDGSPSIVCPDSSPYPLTSAVGTLYGNINTASATEFQEIAISGLALDFLTFN